MNFFLLLAAPLFAVFFSRFLMPRTNYAFFRRGLVTGLLATSVLFAVFWFFRDGWLPGWDPLGLFLHHLIGEFLLFLAPMMVFFILWGPKTSDRWDFYSAAFGWITALMSLLGLRDFYVTMQGFDDYQLFLIPFLRLGLMVIFPALAYTLSRSSGIFEQGKWALAGVGICALGTLLIVFRLLGFPLVSWLGLGALGVLTYFWVNRRYS